MVLTFLSVVLIIVTMPFSLCLVIKVVAEYERAVIFRLGRLRKGGSKGPGIFTVIPCIDTYRCVDLRTVSFDVPPQEVSEAWVGEWQREDGREVVRALLPI